MTIDIPTMIEQKNHALTVTEVAAILAVSKSSLYGLAERNVIPHFRVAGSIRFDPVTLSAWLRDNRK